MKSSALFGIGFFIGLSFFLIGCSSNGVKMDYTEIRSPQLHTGKISNNRYYTPANQILTPTGLQVELPGLRPQALALSPDGKILVTSGKKS
jgi:hypothetical protein